MIIIRMSGGMGNQMFCYALYKTLESRQKDVYIDDFTHYSEIGRNDNNLNEIFSLSYKVADRERYNKLTDSSLILKDRIRRKLFGRRDKIYYEKDAICFEEKVLHMDDIYLIGYWQSEKYFSAIKEKLREDFSFNWDSFPKQAKIYMNQMYNSISISMHVRRGDYLNEKNAPIYGGICTESYYKKAKDYFQNLYSNCTFFLFTNDIEWGKNQVTDNTILVDCTNASNAYIDMALMSCCKHHIIANSSFSWWGAWLNPRHDKTIIAPARWFNNSDGKDIYEGLSPILIDAYGNIQM